jgi:dTDP-4-amino-4,6-dideoxygalactose transaminase
MRAQIIKYRCEEWGMAEILALLRGYTINGSIDQLQGVLEHQYCVPVYLLNSARAGLKIALNQCHKRHPLRKTVLVPSYICNSVPQTITQMGLNVVSVAVNEHFNLCPQAMKAMLDESCLAVVMPHMYGVPADVQKIRQLTHDADVFLIDDAAQVAGIRVDDQLLGTFGDYGMLSFAQAKSIVCGVRGAGGVLFNTSGFPLEVSLTPVNRLSRLPKILHFWAHYIAQGTWKSLDYYVERLQNRLFDKKSNYFPDGFALSEPDASIALTQFSSLEHRINLAVQRAEIVRNQLARCSNIVTPQFNEQSRYVTRFVIQTRLLEPRSLAEELAKVGVESRFVYGNGSRAYDGSHDSGLLELPWIGLKQAETELMVFRLNSINQ